MKHLKLIYFSGCPNAPKISSILKEIGLPFEEIDQNKLPPSHPFRQYTSPTLLLDNQIIWGQKSDSPQGGCSLHLPPKEELKKILLPQPQPSHTTPFSSLTPLFGWLSALTVTFCPLCIPAIGTFLASIGLGFLLSETILKPILLLFLSLTLFGLLYSFLKEHKNPWPFILAIPCAFALYLGRYVYYGLAINQILMYGGAIGIVVLSAYNLFLRKKDKCTTCQIKN